MHLMIYQTLSFQKIHFSGKLANFTLNSNIDLFNKVGVNFSFKGIPKEGTLPKIAIPSSKSA